MPVTNSEFTRTFAEYLHRPAILPTPLPAVSLLFGREFVRDALVAGQRVAPRRLTDAGFEFPAIPPIMVPSLVGSGPAQIDRYDRVRNVNIEVELNGDHSSCTLSSRSVACDHSHQIYLSKLIGNAQCMGHSECDAIIMDKGVVSSIPEITANNLESQLIHEAAIGKIAGDQIIKLRTLGLTEAEAEARIIDGFLK